MPGAIYRRYRRDLEGDARHGAVHLQHNFLGLIAIGAAIGHGSVGIKDHPFVPARNEHLRGGRNRGHNQSVGADQSVTQRDQALAERIKRKCPIGRPLLQLTETAPETAVSGRIVGHTKQLLLAGSRLESQLVQPLPIGPPRISAEELNASVLEREHLLAGRTGRIVNEERVCRQPGIGIVGTRYGDVGGSAQIALQRHRHGTPLHNGWRKPVVVLDAARRRKGKHQQARHPTTYVCRTSHKCQL